MRSSSIPWVWIALAAVLLLIPGTAGRLLLDVLGGLTLLLILAPLLAAGVGFLAWQVIRDRLSPCPTCGSISFGSELCPACGSPLAPKSGVRGQPEADGRMDPAQMTINVEAVDVEPSGDDDSGASS